MTGRQSTDDEIEIGSAPDDDTVEVARVIAQLKTRLLGDETPFRLGRYEVRRWLGAGAFGTVYAAYDPSMRREVAIKVVRPPGEADREAWRASALAEAKALARINHPNVVAALDVLAKPEAAYIVMPLLRGGDLGAWVRQPEVDHVGVIDAIVQGAQGLAAAHAAGVHHLDVKPSNLLRDDDGTVLVTDFGLAREEAGTARGGTPRYMAPEQRRGLAADDKADQFSLALVAMELLVGRLPEDADGPRRAVSRRVAKVLARALDVDPGARFEGIMDFAAAIRAAATPRRLARRLLPWAAVATAGAVVTLTVWPQPPALGCARVADLSPEAIAREAFPQWSSGVLLGLAPAFNLGGQPVGHAWARIEWTLNDFVGAWTDALAAACAPPEEPDVIDCLQLLRGRVRVEVDGLPSTEPEQLAATATRISTLMRPRACAGLARPLTPDDAVALRAVDDARRQIDRGEIDEATATLDSLTTEAGGLGPLVMAEALHARAKLSVRSGETPHAAKLFERAYQSALDAEHAWVAVDAAANAAGIAAATGKLPMAQRWLDAALAAVERAGSPPRLRAKWLTTAMGIARAQGQQARAIALGREALALAADAGPASEGVVTAARGLGIMLLLGGEPSEAEAVLRRALSAAREIWGPQSTALAPVLDVLAGALSEQGRFTAATAMASEAVTLMRRRYGPEHDATLAAELNLAEHHQRAGQAEVAARLFAKVAELAPRGETLLRPKALLATARSLAEAGDVEAARRRATTALVELQSRPEPPAALVDDAQTLLDTLPP